MSKIIQIPYDYQITLPVATAQAAQEKNNDKPISLEALGLLVNLLSYPPTWELHKTELYKRFAKNKETAVRRIWKELVNAQYIIEYKYRTGKRYEYVYFFRKVPFTDKEKAEILNTAIEDHGEIWGLDFQDPKMQTSKYRDNKKNILNKKPILNKNIDDDDLRRTKSNNLQETITSYTEQELDMLITEFREVTKDELTDRSFNCVIKKVMDKYNQGKVTNLRDYLATSLFAKVEELERRKEKDKTARDKVKDLKTKLEKVEVKELYLYNWLE